MAHVLKTYRAANDLSLEALAAKLSLNISTISRIENGKQTIPAEMAVAIESVLEGAVTRHDLRPDLWPYATQ